ncbi:hypothetical protein Val02_08540 [Virgisporangium aliadipatigenens]|uniref:Polyketide cyclase / dehydrase and lipid transport n=1 Tax=Virgisporangium aliadipatigenens TaxID=741659 RepID=A0A8J3YGU7_9ACTN|nr:SRPBCC family protein [Virgisporangium aliadipatigenens]GIJ43968.1 hypothetical protein Val02_08540 [Virgisporangium aliadipatigenens]
MSEISVDLLVAAPADAVWKVIGPGFARIGEWSTAVVTSTAVPRDAADTRVPAAGASAAGRVCDTGLRLVPRITETLVAYDDAARTLTYEAGGMPSFVTLARNTWSVTPMDETRCRVSLRARFDTRGPLGLLGRWVILAQARRAARHLAEDLRHVAETGTPSPRKRRQLRAGRPAGPSATSPPCWRAEV